MPEIPKSPPLIETLPRKNYGISPEEIISGRLARMADNGLQVVTICNHGSGRSYNVAKTLTERGIASVCLKGGLDGLGELGDIHAPSPIYYEINLIPNVAVILTPEEQYMYIQQINQLRAYRYTSSDGAIQSLLRMIDHSQKEIL